MHRITIRPSKIPQCISIPPSKSQTIRAILFAALAHGVSKIHHYLPSPDVFAMVEAVRQLGASVEIQPQQLIIQGCSGHLQTPSDVIQCGNSGLVLRLIGALAALTDGYTILTGDLSLQRRRPVSPLIHALQQLGAFAASSRCDQHVPLIVKGPITRNFAEFDGEDSQPVSAMLIAAAFAPHPITLKIQNPGEKPWVNLTLDWLKKCNIMVEKESPNTFHLCGPSNVQCFEYTVPGDLSSAAFPIAAALLTHSELILHNIDLNDGQGDKIIISILEKMGAQFEIDHPNRRLRVHKESALQGIQIDINDCIDALPIFAALGCFAKGQTKIFNGAIARKKESDRISAIATELSKMGAKITEKADGLEITPSPLHGAMLFSHHDHRIAMALSVAALAAHSNSTIDAIECVDKSYPHFYTDFGIL